MGNRAVISVDGYGTGIYVHWNGGPESVLAFLEAACILGVRDPAGDPAYFTARLAQIIGNFFGGTDCVGVGPVAQLDTENGDNGHYLIGPGFRIVRREHAGSRPVLTVARLGDQRERYEAILTQVLGANRPIFQRGE